MFLSKALLDRRRWDVIHDIEDRDRLHKKVLSFFPRLPGGPCDNARQQLGVLFRVEGTSLLIQSKIAPLTTRLVPGYALVGTKNVAANYAAIRTGIPYTFRLEANTSLQVPDDDLESWVPEQQDSDLQVRRKTRRVGCGNFPARSRWFESIGRRFGFSPEIYFMDALSLLKVKGGVLESTRFDGRLTVVDRTAFQRALEEGVGQGKSYGLGLLSVRNA